MSKTTDYIIDLHNLTEEVKELKEDRAIVYDKIRDLVYYLEENDYKIDKEEIDNFIAAIQNYCG
jgi:hypothetical protein